MSPWKAVNEDFNLSTAVSTTVKELAAMIWERIKGDAPLSLVSDPAYEYDVQKRVPSVRKAKELLGFEAGTGLAETLDEVIPWICRQVDLGNI